MSLCVCVVFIFAQFFSVSDLVLFLMKANSIVNVLMFSSNESPDNDLVALAVTNYFSCFPQTSPLNKFWLYLISL